MDTVILKKSCRVSAIFALVTSVLFFVFFSVSKQSPYFQNVNVFNVDPYDATGSFGIQLAFFCALLAVFRSFRPYKPGGIAAGSQIMILRACALSLFAVVITLFSDIVAMIRFSGIWDSSTNGWVLFTLTLVFMLAVSAFWGVTSIKGGFSERRLSLLSWQLSFLQCLPSLCFIRT